MINEIWKNIQEYEGYYQVSNLGRVKRLERTDIVHNYGGLKKVGEKILKPYADKRRYNGVRVTLCKNNETKRFILSRLVAGAFIENVDNKPYVLHKDDNPTNNVSSNLFWGTPKENTLDALKKGRLICNLPRLKKITNKI